MDFDSTERHALPWLRARFGSAAWVVVADPDAPPGSEPLHAALQDAADQAAGEDTLFAYPELVAQTGNARLYWWPHVTGIPIMAFDAVDPETLPSLLGARDGYLAYDVDPLLLAQHAARTSRLSGADVCMWLSMGYATHTHGLGDAGETTFAPQTAAEAYAYFLPDSDGFSSFHPIAPGGLPLDAYDDPEDRENAARYTLDITAAMVCLSREGCMTINSAGDGRLWRPWWSYPAWAFAPSELSPEEELRALMHLPASDRGPLWVCRARCAAVRGGLTEPLRDYLFDAVLAHMRALRGLRGRGDLVEGMTLCSGTLRDLAMLEEVNINELRPEISPGLQWAGLGHIHVSGR